MKLLLSRSLFAAFLVVAGYASSFAQTTVTLPTIPCSNCNGPGAFATTAPGCTPALVGAPLTMSWGAASGATSYTIMIATDATMSQNVAAYTQIGTSLSVPAYALKPSTTYYWTVFANSATGSTKATGGVCSFITNTTWTSTSLTSGFPNGSSSDQLLAQGIAGGYYTCQKGDGTCASGDNMLCNPQFQQVNPSSPFVPNWSLSNAGFQGAGGYVHPQVAGYTILGVALAGAGSGIPSTGTTTGIKSTAGSTDISQWLYVSNSSSAPMNFEVSAWAKGGTTTIITPAYVQFTLASQATAPTSVSTGQIPINSAWTQFTRTVSLPAGAAIHYISIQLYYYSANATAGNAYLTDVRMCKL